MLKPWKLVGSEITYEDQWLKVRSDDCLTDGGHLVSPYHVLEYPDWVHVIAVTPAFELVLVRQYRHGVGQILMELPCGAIEATDSSPSEAAARELQEETGYLTDSMVQLSPLHVNPATHTNSVWPILGLGARLSQSPELNPTESVEVVRADVGAFVASVRDGTVRLQALHTASLWLALNWIERSALPELVALHRKIAGLRKTAR
jgi:ADP-ribose pyrophosphatase